MRKRILLAVPSLSLLVATISACDALPDECGTYTSCLKDDAAAVLDGDSPDGGDAQFCLITVLRNEGEVVAASAVITRCRDMERAKQRLQSMQLVAGYFDLFSMRRYIEHARLTSERHQHVLRRALH